jgi:predicted lipid-binding transport protein (Tim44 family)
MTSANLTRGVIVFALIAIGSASVVGAQTGAANSGQATQTPDANGDARQDQGTQFGQFGMMGRNMMHPGMMGGMPMGAMRGHMMKIMFAIADVDGDGALSFEEVSTIHKRIFDRVDADKNAKVTPEEMQTFMRE